MSTESRTENGEALKERLRVLEDRLRETEEELKNIFDNSLDGIFKLSPEGYIIKANTSFRRILEYSDSEASKESCRSLFEMINLEPEEKVRLLKILKEDGKLTNIEVKLGTETGEKWVSLNISAVKDGNSNLIYYLGTVRDITKRKMAEEALRESEERYRVAIENSNDGVAIVKDGFHLYVNRRFVQMFEYSSPDEIIGKPITLVVHPEDRSLVFEMNQRRLKGEDVPERYEFRGITKTGRTINVEVQGAKISYRGEEAYLIYLRDVTERKRAEKLLEEEKEKLNTLLQNAPIGIALLDQRGVFTYVNPRFREIFGYDVWEVPDGKTFLRRLFPDPEYRKRVIAEWIENVKTTAVGQRFPRIFKIITPSGEEKVVIFVPVKLATGEHLITFEDITERIKAEDALRKSKEELERLNMLKSKAIDHVSHELKTPSSVLLGNLRILRRKLEARGLKDEFEGILKAMERNSERIMQISREVDDIFKSQLEFETLSLSMEMDYLLKRLEPVVEIPSSIRESWNSVREWLSKSVFQESSESEEIDLRSVLEEIQKIVHENASFRRVDVSADVREGLRLKIDAGILKRSLLGIIKNAIENTPDGGKVEIKAQRLEDQIRIEIKDTGVGITEENLKNLFEGLFHAEPTDLYKSKRPYEFGAGGKGLELFTIKRYSLKHGFRIEVESKRCPHLVDTRNSCPGDVERCPYITSSDGCSPEKGTKFTLSFPLPNPQDREFLSF